MPKPKRVAAARPLVAPRTPDDWERGWQRTWRNVGFTSYELPCDGTPAHEEQDVLAHPREIGFGYAPLPVAAKAKRAR